MWKVTLKIEACNLQAISGNAGQSLQNYITYHWLVLLSGKQTKWNEMTWGDTKWHEMKWVKLPDILQGIRNKCTYLLCKACVQLLVWPALIHIDSQLYPWPITMHCQGANPCQSQKLQQLHRPFVGENLTSMSRIATYCNHCHPKCVDFIAADFGWDVWRNCPCLIVFDVRQCEVHHGLIKLVQILKQQSHSAWIGGPS